MRAGVVRHIGAPSVDYDYHPGFEFGVALRHEHERIFPGFLLPVRPGDVWLACAWELHGYRVQRPDTEVIVVGFLPRVLGEEMLAGTPWLSLFAAPPGHRPRVHTPQTRARVLEIAAEMREEVETRPRGWEEAVRFHLLRLLLALRREWEPSKTDLRAGRTPTTDLMRVMPAVQALHAHLERPLRLAGAAALCELSPSRFSVLFRRTMGVSFAQFSLRTRLAHVAHRLIAGDESIQDIAVRLGFTDGSHLHRLFVTHYHHTPAAYRRGMR